MRPVYDNDLPTGWEQRELRCVSIRKRGHTWEKEQESPKESHDTVPVIRIPNIGERLDLSDLLHLRGVTEEALKESAVSKDWILFVGSNGNPDRIGDSVLIEENRKMVFASFLMGIASKNPGELLPGFLSLWLKIHKVHETFSKTSQQTTGLANFCWGAVKKLPVRFPKQPDEQRAIVDMVRLTNAAIDATQTKVVAAQRLKTALMQRLFTRGIPGRHTKFKHTKIGEIPEEWEVLRIQQVLDGPPFNGVSPQSRDEPPGTPILNVSCIYDGKCDPAHVSYVDVDDVTFAECRARKGDFYVLRGNGNRNYVATGGYLAVEPDPPCIFSDKLIRIRFKPEMIVEGFIPMMWQSSAFLRRFQSKAESGSGLWMMSKRDIRREYFARPKMDEQEQIVSLLRAADDNIAGVEHEIEALRKLKTSLLQNLLTAKVRVKTET